MQQNEDQQRHIADKKFQKSLEHLEDILQERFIGGEAQPKLDHICTDEVELIETVTDINLAAWEDAVADIEAYLDKKLNK
ncbi:hypothetical protein [Nodularia sp. UHCC 0506]|uniref:hypothetical protein n=1 Tax=Nodularia sp. UHCC 0506 TaxID=3110243 RepID=UPI002B1FA24E|nr:hypothetical protein [Nodularia sp. UHCC 0506]MEA5516931.1 hypothetical protein [Nodularia sp. UHCC 0506]